ncbi:MAG: hypothetical protein DCC68_07320 [Planctomycetota bacterium]|nr:MAG: hypothetical protein DCC68_07320 [Planctomycetota bacterium]
MTSVAAKRPPETTANRPRVVVLGASNVTRGISTIVETAQLALGGPIELYAAFGHGRSLGLYTRVLGRGLCSLLDAGLWRALDDRPRPDASFALLTDIGNDLMYEVPPEKICRWVEKILERCQSVARRVVVTELPLASIERLGPRRFAILRSVIFPRCRLALDEARRRAIEINDAVRRAARERGATVVAHDAAWYGLDPIHIRRREFARAWNAVLSAWNVGDRGAALARGSLRRWIQLGLFSPEKRAFFGIERSRRQPAGALRDGSTVWLY